MWHNLNEKMKLTPHLKGLRASITYAAQPNFLGPDVESMWVTHKLSPLFWALI